jgi:hypothetical protein
VGIGSKEPSSSPPIDHQARDLHWPPSMGSFIDHQAWDPPIDHQARDLHWPPSKGSFIDHQTRDPSLTTKQGIFIDHQARDLHWPPSMGSSFDHQAWEPPSSLLLLFKRRLGWLGGSLLALGNFLEYWFHKLFEGKWGWNLGQGRRKGVEGRSCNSFKEWGWGMMRLEG